MSDTVVIERAFAVDLTEVEGRMVEGRAVPYGEVATVADEQGQAYRERWEFGAFRKVVPAARRVGLKLDHSTGLAGTAGSATRLEEREDGLYGTWRLYDTDTGNTALELIRSGVARGLSVGARVSSRRRIDPEGVVVRSSAHLEHVALCAEPAYAGAKVLAVRSGRPRVELVPWNDELDERLRALGVLPTI